MVYLNYTGNPKWAGSFQPKTGFLPFLDFGDVGNVLSSPEMFFWPLAFFFHSNMWLPEGVFQSRMDVLPYLDFGDVGNVLSSPGRGDR